MKKTIAGDVLNDYDYKTIGKKYSLISEAVYTKDFAKKLSFSGRLELYGQPHGQQLSQANNRVAWFVYVRYHLNGVVEYCSVCGIVFCESVAAVLHA